MFDANQFLDQQIEGANDTKIIPIPVGEYTGVADEVKPRTWTSKDKTQSGVVVDITWNLDDQALKDSLGRQKVTVRQSIMLDLTESGSIDMSKGRNIGLGRLREALGLNDPSVPFAFAQIVGKIAKVSVSQRVDGEDIYNDVKGLAKL